VIRSPGYVVKVLRRVWTRPRLWEVDPDDERAWWLVTGFEERQARRAEEAWVRREAWERQRQERLEQSRKEFTSAKFFYGSKRR
jgi:hypothetical protein